MMSLLVSSGDGQIETKGPAAQGLLRTSRLGDCHKIRYIFPVTSFTPSRIEHLSWSNVQGLNYGGLWVDSGGSQKGIMAEK